MAHKGAAKVLAEVISGDLGLNQEEEIGNWSESKNQGEYVMITLEVGIMHREEIWLQEQKMHG